VTYRTIDLWSKNTRIDVSDSKIQIWRIYEVEKMKGMCNGGNKNDKATGYNNIEGQGGC